MNSILGIIAIFIFSRAVLRHMFLFLHSFTRSQSVGIGVISVLYFPGTVVHEMSHYVIALLLNMHPCDVSLFPVIEGRRVRLGHVEYERQKGDFIRPILVGIAPLFGATVVLWLIIQANLLFQGGVFTQIITGYFLLSVTANMFSSDQDLKYSWYLVPLGFVLGLVYYVIPFTIHPGLFSTVQSAISSFLTVIEPAILFSAVGHGILLLVFILINKQL